MTIAIRAIIVVVLIIIINENSYDNDTEFITFFNTVRISTKWGCKVSHDCFLVPCSNSKLAIYSSGLSRFSSGKV